MTQRPTPVMRLVGLLCALLSVSGCAREHRYDLVIGSSGQDRVLKRFPLKEGDRFYLDYTHSSEKTPIHDVFLIDTDGKIVLVEERFSWYAVGLESNPEYRGASIHFEKRDTRVDLHREFPVVPLRVGWIAGQVITVGDERVELNRIAASGSLLEIRTEKPSLWRISWGTPR